MKTFQSLLPAFGLIAAAQAWGSEWNQTYWTTTTVTTDVYTTYCPAPTTVVQNSKTYTVTEATTLTITECPCTIVKSTTCPPPYTPTGVVPPPPVKNSTVPIGTGSHTKKATTTQSVSYFTTYCPSSTVVTIGSQTYSLSSGTQTVAITTPPPVISATNTPVGPTSATTTGPLQVTNAAMHFEAGVGAIAAAGLAALLL